MNNLSKIAIVGNFPPRQCGIATFTADLLGSLKSTNQDASVFAVAMNDASSGYDYGDDVHLELLQGQLEDYHQAADFLNLRGVDVVSVQHEFGIYGGQAGSYLLTLMHELEAPIVTTLHTVLERPDAAQRAVMNEIARYSERLIVMSDQAQHFLESVYHVPQTKIDAVPHGIPDVAFAETELYKPALGLESKTVLLTFGLLSPNKGLEQAIRALPQIVEAHPDAVYVILGATHPHLLEHEGEAYRSSLQKLARNLEVENQVIFFDQFVELDELLKFIGAADIYLTPYGNREQIVSGTLAYALGAGKAIVSTPYWYAEELLAEGRGVLTPFNDSTALADNVVSLLNDEARAREMRLKAYTYGRKMVWREVAERYGKAFRKAQMQHLHHAAKAPSRQLGL